MEVLSDPDLTSLLWGMQQTCKGLVSVPILPKSVCSAAITDLQVFWTNFITDYSVLAFHINGVQNTWAVWSTVYFWPNLVVILGTFLGPIILLARKQRKGLEQPDVSTMRKED